MDAQGAGHTSSRCNTREQGASMAEPSGGYCRGAGGQAQGMQLHVHVHAVRLCIASSQGSDCTQHIQRAPTGRESASQQQPGPTLVRACMGAGACHPVLVLPHPPSSGQQAAHQANTTVNRSRPLGVSDVLLAWLLITRGLDWTGLSLACRQNNWNFYANEYTMPPGEQSLCKQVGAQRLHVWNSVVRGPLRGREGCMTVLPLVVGTRLVGGGSAGCRDCIPCWEVRVGGVGHCGV
jgi:hypothetical protein